jgi:carbamoyl-phosphate synthase large subunit
VLDKRWSRRCPFRLLLSCAGRRVELMNAFRRAADRLSLPLKVYAADASWLAPAMHLADSPSLVPPVESPRYIPELLRLVRRERIDMIVPLLDPELPKMSEARDAFARAGALALISSPAVVGTCRDKIRTYRFLSKAGLDTPETWTWREALSRRRHRFPYFMKPRRGSASRGNYKVVSLDELRTFGRHVAEPIVQEFVAGAEHTLDVYTGLDGVPRCAVPRRRLEVRGGEVVKSVIVKDPRLIEVGFRVVVALKECMGVITIQLIVTPDGRIRVIEVNPRFGGGAPLAIHAGADFPRWLLATAIGREPTIRRDGYRDGECMLRFDESAFILADSHPPKSRPRMVL